MNKPISRQSLKRLPLYLGYLRSLPVCGSVNTSATAIAQALGLSDVQVRKDIAQVSQGGRPKTGYVTHDLIADIELFLGYNDTNCAVLVGAGYLGHALLRYDGFAKYGLQIVAAFDTDEALIGKSVGGKPILPVEKLADLCARLKVCVGIIAVPAAQAQAVCDRMVAQGVRAIWNFAPIALNTPGNILVHNENLADSLAALSGRLGAKLA